MKDVQVNIEDQIKMTGDVQKMIEGKCTKCGNEYKRNEKGRKSQYMLCLYGLCE